MKNRFIEIIAVSISVVLFFSIILVGWVVAKEDIHSIYTPIKISGEKGKEILKGGKVTATFTATHSNLGTFFVRFTNFNKINTDTVVFRIKETNSSHLLAEHIYKVDQFLPDELFPLGFPIQSKSLNKSYSIEIESLNGEPGNAIGISTVSPHAELLYYFPIQDLLHNPIHIGEVIGAKLSMYFSNASFVLLIVILYISSSLCILAILHMKFLYKKRNMIFLLSSYWQKYSLISIIVIGTVIRFALATGPYNGDTEAFYKASTFFNHHLFNVYANTNGYNYSPLMFFVFNLLDAIQEVLKIFAWPFLWRVFLSCFDVATLFVLVSLAKIKKIDSVKTAILFFLNPVSVIISGHHGQFENIAIFFLLLAVLLHYKTQKKENSSLLPKWLLLTVSLLVKHIIVYQLLVFWRVEVRKVKKILLLFFLSVFFFLISFIPYWPGAKEQIIKNVFLYGGAPGDYGITYFLVRWLPGFTFYGLYQTKIYMYIFMTLLFTLPLLIRRKDMLRNMLFMFLFFVSFTSGIGIQYFVLPIALGALFPTKWFYLYSIIVSLAYVGGLEQFLPFHIRAFSFISFNTIWIFALLWFFSELFYLSKKLRMLYHTYILS